MSGPADILLRIAARRRERVAEANGAGRGEAAALSSAPPRSPADNAFLAALAARRAPAGSPAIPATPAAPAIPAAPAPPAIIAEVKMGSPRLGPLAGRVDPERQAETYAAHGAAALSVVVEPDFFFGSYELLCACKAASGLPAIAKDFIVDPLQLHWAKAAGADAVLLIAALLTTEELVRYAGWARGLGLVPLIETHSKEEVAKLSGADWELVGVNNRNLRTFTVDLAHSIDLLPSLPPQAFKVAESGIDGRAALARLHQAGFDAFLIGESLLLAEHPAAMLRELLG